MNLPENVPSATKFASPARSTAAQINQSKETILNQEFFTRSLNAYPDVVLVLNGNRQIVYANQKLIALLGIKCVEDVLGKRPGEAINCVRSNLEPGGCGTSLFCRECGAVRAILTAQKGKEDFQECRITVATPQGEAALDLRVWAVPVHIQDQTFTFFTIRDIADEKRREVLERTFFHDILNEAGILAGYSENMKDGLVPPEEKPAEKIHRYSQRLIEFIQEQRDLLNAEKGTYVVQQETFLVYPYLHELVTLYQQNRLARNRRVVLECPNREAVITTDPILLRRIIGNLIKNALEATAEGGTVTVKFWQAEGKKIFSVQNPAFIPEDVQLQLFQRSFSTKGKGRGIGTYSIKLFTENYLKGKVSFDSASTRGTTFFVRLL